MAKNCKLQIAFTLAHSIIPFSSYSVLLFKHVNAFLLIPGIVWFSFCPCGVLTSQWSTINPVEIIIFSVKSKPNTRLWHVGLIQDHIKYERVLFGWPHNWKVSCVSLTAYASIAPVREWNFEKKVTWVSMFHPVLLVVWAFLLKTKEENDQSEKKNDERWRPRKSYFSIKITVLKELHCSLEAKSCLQFSDLLIDLIYFISCQNFSFMGYY